MSFYKPIEAGRRLVPPAIVEMTGETEYYDPERQGRYLHLLEGSAAVAQHRRLAKLGLAVFDAVGVREGGMELSIPPGTMTIRQALGPISKDISGYKEIFQQFGDIIRGAEQVGLGGLVAVHGRTLLSGVAFSPDEVSPYGGAVRFVPPYRFESDVDLVANLLSARKEMNETGYFPNGAIDWLLGQAAIGYDRHGD